MNNLKLIEDGLISVYQGENGQLVNARELHGFLEVGTKFTDWIKDRIEKYGFIENEDFTSFSENTEKPIGGRPITEYILTLDTAKEIAMVQNNDKGKEIRKYFISIEKKYKQATVSVNQLSPELQMFKQIFDNVAKQELEQKKLQQEVRETKEEVQAMREVVEIRPFDSWREETNSLVKKICYKLKDYKLPKEEIYKALQERGACDLKIRLKNMRARLLLNGGSKSKADTLNYLDVIAEDKKLIEIYTAIVKEMAFKYTIP